MKITVTVTVDCTPDEARGFLGLPDVKPLQEELLAEVAAAIRGNLQAMDPMSLLETWLPATVKGLEQWQDMFLKAAQRK